MSISLSSAVAAIEAGDIATAQAQLMQLLRQDVRNEGAWLLLAQCVSDEGQRRTCLQRVIALNPANELAQCLLAVLDDLPNPSASEPEGFQPRPFAVEERPKHTAEPMPVTSMKESPDFQPQPFILAGTESEAPLGTATPSAQTAILPPWMRSPR